MKNKILLFIVFSVMVSFFANDLYAQKQIKYIVQADKAFEQNQYAIAITKYKKAISKIKNNKSESERITYQVALCYYKMGDYRYAEMWMKRVVNYKKFDPIAIFYYAEILRFNEKYEDAIKQYEAYKLAAPSTNIEKYIESCKLGPKWTENPTRYEIENVRQLNSKDNDFCPMFADKRYSDIILTSSREGALGKGVDAWTNKRFTDLFLSHLDRKKSTWSTPVPLPEPVSTVFNEGSSCMNVKFTTMYFTRCKYEKNKVFGCQIYRTSQSGEGWDEPELVPIFDDSTISVGHPALSADELELYFSCNTKDNIGGLDLWMISRGSRSEAFSNPQNLGNTINTKGDECFPYMRENGELYFASNSHIGLGGLDIFKTAKIDNKWQDVENLKSPINSPQDDYAIIFQGNDEVGFFTSNRKGGRGDDIYKFNLPPLEFSMKGTVRDDSTRVPIPGASIKLLGSNGSSVATLTNEKGMFFFDKSQILPNTTYELFVFKEKYFTAKGQETTIGLSRNKEFVNNFDLKLIPKKSIELPEILYDLAKWDLKQEYQDSLNGLVQTMLDNPTIVIELGSHTDSRASDEYNDTLSQRRAQSVVDYLIQKGIAADRMVAKGYGERIPKVLDKDIIKEGFTFYKGTVLNHEFIESLKTSQEKEIAHQMNRRTEFRVLRDDYIPKDNNPILTPENILNNKNQDDKNKEDKRKKEIEEYKKKNLTVPNNK